MSKSFYLGPYLSNSFNINDLNLIMGWSVHCNTENIPSLYEFLMEFKVFI
jgi:hypothetical protein